MVAGREDVRQEGQVLDLRHGLRFIGKLQQVEVGIGAHDVLRLSPDPSTHVDVSICGARARGVDVEADTGFPVLAVATSTAGDVERNRDEVTHLDELNVAPGLDHLTGYFMPQYQSGRSGGAAADHVLVASANIRGDDLQDNAVLAFASSKRQLGEVDRLNLHFARAHVSDPSVGCSHL